MRNRFQQKIISFLLSTLVLALGVTPPGVEHAHAGGGDSDHRHQKNSNTDSYHSPDHHSHDHHSGEKHHKHETPSAALAGSVLHLHWQILGIDISIPLSEKSTNQQDHEENVPSALLSVMREMVLTAQVNTSLNRMLLAAACEWYIADVVSSQEPVPRLLGLVTTIPLCDSARLERSGVLLS